MSIFSEAYMKLLTALQKKQVDYLLIGGHAVIFHGVRRTTSDIDILVRPTVTNGKKLIDALREINLVVDDVLPGDFEKEVYLSFGFEPDAVDLLNFTPGIDFDEAYQNAVDFKVEGLSIKIIDIKDLIRNKENLNRTDDKSYIDQYDVSQLKRILELNKRKS